MAPGQTLLETDTEATLVSVLEAAFAEIDVADCDAIIASGDLAHQATEAVYRRFHSLITQFFNGPLLCLPGNHDVLSAMQAASLPMQSIIWSDWQLVALDSHEDDKPQSLITEIDRRALSQAVAGTQSRHILLATHHPLVEVQCPWLDRDRIVGPLELLNWLNQEANGACAVLCLATPTKKYKPWSGHGRYLACRLLVFSFSPKAHVLHWTDLRRAISG